MRLLVVNPNTSPGATRNIDAAFKALAAPQEDIHTITAAFGPELIVTPDDAAQAERGVLAAIDAQTDAYDGIILASFGDTGSDAVRRIRPEIPVVGIAGASLAMARALGGRMSIVSFSERMRASIEAIVERHDMMAALDQIVLLPHEDRIDPGTVQDSHGPRLADLCRACARGDARSIILAGGPLAGLARRPGFDLRVPVIDGPQAALSILRGVVSGAPGGAGSMPS